MTDTMKFVVAGIAGGLVVLLLSVFLTAIGGGNLGGVYSNTEQQFEGGIDVTGAGDIKVNGTTVIDTSGNVDAPITSTGAITSDSGNITATLGDVVITDGRVLTGTETGGTCSSGLIIDLSVKAKGVLTTIGETNTACAISFTNGTAGEIIFLSHDYNGTGIITFADVTGWDAAWTPVVAECTGTDAAVTAASSDHFYISGVMTSATEIMITGCNYFDAA